MDKRMINETKNATVNVSDNEQNILPVNPSVDASSRRLYSLDLLRMIAMFMVAVLHVLGQGGVLETVRSGSEYAVAWFLEILCYGAVNVYAIISGYVGVSALRRYKNIIKLWLRVFFYSVLETVLFYFMVPGSVGWGEAVKAVFPVMTNQYWYFTAYFPLFFLMPLLNEGMKRMSRREATSAMAATLILFSVLQTFFSEVFVTAGGYSVLWLLVMYVLGAYLRVFRPFDTKMEQKPPLSPFVLFLLFLGFSLVTWLIKVLAGWSKIVNYISPTVVGAAICLFLCFERIRIPKESRAARWIGFFSPMAFSVYLIHVHPLFWNIVFKGAFTFLPGNGQGGVTSALLMGIGVLACALGIFVAGSLIDIPRQMLEKKVVEPLLRKWAERFECERN